MIYAANKNANRVAHEINVEMYSLSFCHKVAPSNLMRFLYRKTLLVYSLNFDKSLRNRIIRRVAQNSIYGNWKFEPS